jgi:pyrimidine deaminase RibD-like protein
MDKHFQKAIELAKQSRQEIGKITPFVGALAIDQNGNEIETAFRGEKNAGDHGEFTLLELKLSDKSLSGCTLIVTLEPCTKRGVEKIPCAERIIERKIKRVFIGMLDPNPDILGQGVRKLRDAGIDVQMFPNKYADEVEELNREFIRSQQRIKINTIPAERIQQLKKRSLDEWYLSLNQIYWNRNYYKDTFYIFTHLVEVIGGLSLLASSKKKEGVDGEAYIAKAIAWWFALCGKVGIKSVEEMLWNKFPRVCPYCQNNPHLPDECTERKLQAKGVDWDTLEKVGEKNEKPKNIGEWQLMFSSIYPAQQTEEYGPSFARLSEELGELAEALRIFSSVPGYFLSEACDVFAWLMHIQNIIETKKGILKAKRGELLNASLANSYPDICLDCSKPVCACPPVLSKTIGRIGHEVPTRKGSYDQLGHFMTVDKTSKKFSE